MIEPRHLRQRLIAREGTPTLWGGRTVLIEEAPTPYRDGSNYRNCHVASSTPGKYQRPTNGRNHRIQTRYLEGATAADLANEFHLHIQTIFGILHALQTPMRRPGKRA